MQRLILNIILIKAMIGTGQLITEIEIDVILPRRYGFEKLITDN
jgi:hypothetical protein